LSYKCWSFWNLSHTSWYAIVYLCRLLKLFKLVPLVEQELLTLPEHLWSPLDFRRIRITQSLVEDSTTSVIHGREQQTIALLKLQISLQGFVYLITFYMGSSEQFIVLPCWRSKPYRITVLTSVYFMGVFALRCYFISCWFCV
jgi:hypothetical protein